MQSKELSQNTKEYSIAKAEEELKKVEEKMEENSLAFEMIKGKNKEIKGWKTAFFVTLVSAFVIIGLIVGIFSWQWSQYDFKSTTEEIKKEVSVDSTGGGDANYNEVKSGGDVIIG